MPFPRPRARRQRARLPHSDRERSSSLWAPPGRLWRRAARQRRSPPRGSTSSTPPALATPSAARLPPILPAAWIHSSPRAPEWRLAHWPRPSPAPTPASPAATRSRACWLNTEWRADTAHFSYKLLSYGDRQTPVEDNRRGDAAP